MLFGKKKLSTSEDFERQKKELAYAIRVAIGHRNIETFMKDMKMVNVKPIVELLNKNYKELPNRQLLRKIANCSEGRITFQHLYAIFGYKLSDPEEDRSWRSWIPKRGDIFYADLGIGEDSIQGGERPVLIIGNDLGLKYSDILFGIPISTKNKGNNKMHVYIEKEYGLAKNSYALCEQTKVMSKRIFFYNNIPWKVCALNKNKIEEINHVLEMQLGIKQLNFNQEKAFEMIDKIKVLQRNISVKKSKDLIDICEEKISELINYCGQYYKNYDFVIKEYERLQNNSIYA